MCIATSKLRAQDLSNISDAKWSLSGGLGAGLSAYSLSGDRPGRTTPFAYVLSGNLNLSYGDFSIPVSVSYRDQQGSISNPFQRFGLSPTYKWATVHLGWRSVPLGQFLYSGQDFLGVGVELNPGKFRFAALQGRLRSPRVQRDSLFVGAELFETYQRSLLGGRIGVGTDANHFDLVAVRVRDELTDEPPPSREEGFLPSDNLGFSAQLKLLLWQKVSLRGETSLSAITNDRERDSLDVANEWVDRVATIMDVNETSRVHFAHDYRLGFNFSPIRIGLEFQQVDPFYRSLGTPYLTNDIRRLNARLGFALGGGKVRIDSRLGRQRNNLNNLLITTSARWIGSLSIQARLSPKLNLRVRYYNFQTELEDGLVIVDDTLRRGQQTATYTISPTYRQRKNGKTLTIRFNANYRDIAFQQPGRDRQNLDQTSLKLSGGQQWSANDIGYTANIRWWQSGAELIEREQQNVGLGVNVNKGLLDKQLRLGSSAQFTQRTRGGEADGSVFNIGFTANYRITPKSLINLRSTFLVSGSPVPQRDFTEARNHLSYRLTF
ncbi:MAG: hypothetical protein AB8F78_09890 [Saprospiraceae bacterium]